MLKRRLCEATFEWTFHCKGPLLVADGRWEQERDRRSPDPKLAKELPDKLFQNRQSASAMWDAVAVRKQPPESLGLSYFVPGTSLRGPLRAQCERILRSVLPAEARPPATACDPFETDDEPSQSCSQRFDDTTPDVPYASACPSCKLFGCTGTASRIELGDAGIGHPEGDRFHSVYRDMIGIDRFTGGVHNRANMRFHVLENTAFGTTVTVRNFELWQIGLLAFAWRDFEQRRVSIGFGKTKGFGQVEGKIARVVLTYPKGRTDGRIQHLGSLASPEEVEHYDLRPTEPPECPLEPVRLEGIDLYDHFEVRDLPSFWTAVAGAFTEYLASVGEG